MDIIERAMAQEKHITDNVKLKGQVWDCFERECRFKKVFVFGTGAAAEFFFRRYKNSLKIEGVIDSDRRKQGLGVKSLIPSAWEYLAEEIFVTDISSLERYSANEVVVLITSTNYYEQIAQQLINIGINNYFSLLIMEAEERSSLKKTKVRNYSEDELYRLYVEKYAKEPIYKKKIVLRAFGNYSDHEKYITEALLKKRNDLDIVWIVSELNTIVPAGVRLVFSGNWKQMIYEFMTARVWISDLPMCEFLQKRNGQIYIQTKHWASITLKKFYLDAATFRTEPEKIALWKHDSRMIDYIITGSDFDTETSRRGFGYQGEILQIGSSRSDAMFCPDKNKEKVYEYFNIDKKKHTILYAPTYRFDRQKGKSKHESRNIELDYGMLKSTLEKRFGGEWYIILRLHPSVAATSKSIDKPYYVIDASEYVDSQELVSAAEITISDYSSIMFEPAFVKKPVLLFATDKEDYIDKEYDLLIDYDDLPFSIAETNDELRKNIELFDMEKYEKAVDAFLRKYGVHEDGHASERAADFISSLIN